MKTTTKQQTIKQTATKETTTTKKKQLNNKQTTKQQQQQQTNDNSQSTRTDFVMWLRARAMAYSATTVLPADVWAATKTFCFASNCNIACFWNVSNLNGYCVCLCVCEEQHLDIIQTNHNTASSRTNHPVRQPFTYQTNHITPSYTKDITTTIQY